MAIDLYREVTNRILGALEEGIVPWVRPWNQAGEHQNLVSNREYSGINVFLLNITAGARGYASPYWLTLKQCNELGGHVRAGERATKVVFWKMQIRDTGTKDGAGEPILESFPVLKQYCVFNTEQCNLPEGKVPEPPSPTAFDLVGAAEVVWNGYPNRPSLHSGDARYGPGAFYHPAADAIFLPEREKFHEARGYYHTLFHEAIHSTGHFRRLDRSTLTQMGRFGDENYSQEELVAELGASMLLSKAGMTPDIPNSASYIHGWLQALRNDKRLVLVAAQRAQKAANHVLGIQRDRPTEGTSAAAVEA